MPDHWHECTTVQLKWFTKNGTTSQKSIARLHLRMRKYVKDHYKFETSRTALIQPMILWAPHEAITSLPSLLGLSGDEAVSGSNG
jgi:hypothetical protein